LQKQGWAVDVVLVDYADLLAVERNMEERAKQNHIWKGLRAIAQEFNCLVVSPTQTNADSYTKNLITLKNFSEDKRKFSHVTAMYGMNQDVEGREKEIGILRLNKIMMREADFKVTDQVTILQHLPTGQPILTSYY
jgi:hypothetical protein